MIAPLLSICLLLLQLGASAQSPRVLGLYTGQHDRAHISFVKEAHTWLTQTGKENGFEYIPSTNWDLLHADSLQTFALVIFLDTRPEKEEQRQAFETYMKKGGAWLGFHFSAFALSPSAYPQNWDWYHQEFLGTGQYASNTWRPTPAFLSVENKNHAVTNGLPAIWKSAPNEWYKWEKDLRQNPDISILCAIDSSSFPLGTGPKAHEIWHSGYYPVVWTNKKYNMVYVNMGHNDIDYEGGTNKELSFTFANGVQNQLISNALQWLLSRSGQRVISTGN